MTRVSWLLPWIAGVLLVCSALPSNANARAFDSYGLVWDTGRPTLADVNGDGLADLVTADASKSYVSVRLAGGDGTFGPLETVATAASPNMVAVGDLNGDGRADLAVAAGDYNGTSHEVSVLLGNGDGSFQPYVGYATTLDPVEVVIADFNHDGYGDLATADYRGTEPPYPGGNVSVLLNRGDGTFAPASTYPLGSMAASIATGDFNRDGAPDLVVGNGAWGGISVLTNRGDGSFVTSVVSTAPVSAATTGDFNEDGVDDIAAGDGNAVEVLLANGDGTFRDPVSYAAPNAPGRTAVADVDGDGHMDVVAASTQSGYNTSILGGRGDGSFDAPYTVVANGSVPSLTVGDVNGDTQPDLVGWNWNFSFQAVFLNRDQPAIATDPSLDFGTLEPGTIATRQLRVTDAGPGFLTLTGATLQGSAAADYSIGADMCLDRRLTVGASCLIELVDHADTQGARLAELDLSAVGGGSQTVPIRATVGSAPVASPTETPTGSPSGTPTTPLPSSSATPATCRVPSLRGRTLGQARHRLRSAGCRLGSALRPRRPSHGGVLVVRRQSPRPHALAPAGSAVAVWLRLARS